MTRLFFISALVALIPILPWWLSGLLGLIGLFYFRRFWETIVIFFLYDLAFGLSRGGWLQTQFSFTIVFILAYFLVEAYKENLRFN